jgi:hypothetical protein
MIIQSDLNIFIQQTNVHPVTWHYVGPWLRYTGQRHHRPCGEAGDAKCGWRQARRDGEHHHRQSNEVQLLHRRVGREGLSVEAVRT